MEGLEVHDLFLLTSLLQLYSMMVLVSLQLVRRYTGGHKGSISCLMTFMASSGEVVFYFLKQNLCH